MKKTPLWRVAALAVSLSVALPMAAHAHRAWMLPSATVLSGNEPWVTVDAAVSNDLFYFEHNALRLDGLAIIAPDGSAAAAENKSTGKYRSTFDVKLTQKGTYKLTMVNDGLSASYKVGTENKRWRGSAETFAKEVPADAKDLNVSRNRSQLALAWNWFPSRILTTCSLVTPATSASCSTANQLLTLKSLSFLAAYAIATNSAKSKSKPTRMVNSASSGRLQACTG
jgi:hypothetical protein